MEITILERDDGITHIVLAGRLDTTAAEELGADISAAATEQNRPAIIDVSGIEFLASMGIGTLLAISKRMTKAGYKLIVLNPQGMVDVVLKASKLNKVMSIVHDLDEALEILQADQQQDDASDPQREVSAGYSRPQETSVSTADPATENTLKLAIKNEISEFKTLNASLAQFLAAHTVPSRAAYAVDLAVEELVMNVIRYAFLDDDTHSIEIELAIEGDQIVLRIVDDGRPFDPRENPVLDLQSDDREVGGLGLYLVLDMVDMLKYERVDEENRVEVRVSMIVEDQGEDLSEAVSDLPETSGG
ncbi:MAG: anti-sigma factor antagonist [Planctomycetaceae bacterium]|jgi:anti-anti-sigma factor|nr:anti-sigma factor antagonist [Planctomycetaceae bacterium]